MLTLFAFSKENWKRPQEEVDTLMELLRAAEGVGRIGIAVSRANPKRVYAIVDAKEGRTGVTAVKPGDAFFARTEREVRLRILEGRRSRVQEDLERVREASARSVPGNPVDGAAPCLLMDKPGTYDSAPPIVAVRDYGKGRIAVIGVSPVTAVKPDQSTKAIRAVHTSQRMVRGLRERARFRAA